MEGAWPGRWVKVLRPERGGSIQATLLGRFVEVPLHPWVEGIGSIPCWGVNCRYCRPQVQVENRYYAPAIFLKTNTDDGPAFVECKPGVVELYESHMERFEGKQVRGTEIEVKKTHKGKLYLCIRRVIPEEILASLQREFDVVPIMERFFKMPLVCPSGEPQEKPDTVPFRKQA